MGRVEDYLGDRLRGRVIPDDLRRLVELELDGVLRGPDSPSPFDEMHVLAPGERHALERQDYRPDESAETLANGRAIDEVLALVTAVVDGFNGDLFGYWLHPDEQPAGQPAIVKLDTEGVFDTPPGTTLVEAMVFDRCEDEELAPIVAFCERYEIPLAARSHAEVTVASTVVSPGSLHDLLYRRYRPRAPIPPRTADEDALVGLRITDPPLAAFLVRLGHPDPAAAVEALDDGGGAVRLESPVAEVVLALNQADDDSWWLYSARYRRPTAERPLEVPLPYGFSLYEDRQATRDRLGPPARTAIMPVDVWLFGKVEAYVLFDHDGPAKFIQFSHVDGERLI